VLNSYLFTQAKRWKSYGFIPDFAELRCGRCVETAASQREMMRHRETGLSRGIEKALHPATSDRGRVFSKK
jgi:hypothetical protein